MQVNMSLREELDTRLISWFQYKTAKENHDLMQKKVLMDLQQRRIKVAALMESRRRFEIWKQVILKEIEFKKSRMAFPARSIWNSGRILKRCMRTWIPKLRKMRKWKRP